MPTNNLNIVILAAGKGSRMRSNIAKVLHRIAGKPIIQHVIDTVKQLNPKTVNIVYGSGGSQVRENITTPDLHWVLQEAQLGTGHALQQAIPHCAKDGKILSLYGDVPLISKETLQQLIQVQPKNGIGLLTIVLDNPFGYGRIIRNEHKEVVGIIEEKDANEQQKAIKEINTGILIADNIDLARWLSQLKNNNSQGEFYLTDIIALAKKEGKKIETVHSIRPSEVEGVNNRLQLAYLEREYQKGQAEQLMLNGVTLLSPERFDLRGQLEHGQDVIIDANVIIEGHVVLGNNVIIEAGCIIKNSIIGDNSIISPYSVIEKSKIGKKCTIGPFARIRPDSTLKDNVHLGNFVEVKKSVIGRGSKSGHLSYLGDAVIGEQVNIGAGTITCNYDGVNKSTTIIEDNVFIGADSQLIAPVKIEKGATVAAGTTVTKNVGQLELAISRTTQKNITTWQRPSKK